MDYQSLYQKTVVELRKIAKEQGVRIPAGASKASIVQLILEGGRKAAAPEKAEPAPERAETAPEKAEPATEKAETAPEKAEPAPEKAETAPEKAESAPEKAETAPEKAELATERAETAPEKAESAPKKTAQPEKRRPGRPRIVRANADANINSSDSEKIQTEKTENAAPADKPAEKPIKPERRGPGRPRKQVSESGAVREKLVRHEEPQMRSPITGEVFHREPVAESPDRVPIRTSYAARMRSQAGENAKRSPFGFDRNENNRELRRSGRVLRENDAELPENVAAPNVEAPENIIVATESESSKQLVRRNVRRVNAKKTTGGNNYDTKKNITANFETGENVDPNVNSEKITDETPKNANTETINAEVKPTDTAGENAKNENHDAPASENNEIKANDEEAKSNDTAVKTETSGENINIAETKSETTVETIDTADTKSEADAKNTNATDAKIEASAANAIAEAKRPENVQNANSNAFRGTNGDAPMRRTPRYLRENAPIDRDNVDRVQREWNVAAHRSARGFAVRTNGAPVNGNARMNRTYANNAARQNGEQGGYYAARQNGEKGGYYAARTNADQNNYNARENNDQPRTGVMRTADGNAARQNGERTGYNGARQTGEQNTEQNGYNVARVNSDQNTYNASTRQQGDANGYIDPVRANGDYASYDDQNGYGVRSNADANGFRANGYDTDNAQNGEADSDAVYRDDPVQRTLRAQRATYENGYRRQENDGANLQDVNFSDGAGLLEIQPDGYGFLRAENCLPGSRDVYISIAQIRRFGLKAGDFVEGKTRPQREGDRYSALVYINRVNGESPEKALQRKPFESLVPWYPNERLRMENPKKPDMSLRMIDVVAPIGKGQRGMIVSQPKAGKTTLLKKIANAISDNNPEVKLIVLLIDERPEEVTDMKHSIRGDVIYSTFDSPPTNHARVSEMVLAHAQRLVESGKDVVILLDSITRLARAYNLIIPPTGRSLSGGLDPGALYKPKKFFGAARNIENGGSLTIIATALVDTGSRMDDIIFEEFKGTGNMELHLDRKLSDKRIFPAIDLLKSGTRREELLLAPEELDGEYQVRKMLTAGGGQQSTEQLISLMEKTTNNADFFRRLKGWMAVYEKDGYTLGGKGDR